jgi:shikimate dehydrogenase
MQRRSPDWPTAASNVVGVIGYPVSHSLSPLLHQAAFDALDLDWVSVGFAVSRGDVSRALEGMRALWIVGLSVTMPHKADAAVAVDELTPLAGRLGAVNCVINREGTLIGDSTDGAGLLAALEEASGVVPKGKRCVVIGAGGAARAAVAALGDAGAAEVAVLNRTPARAEEAAALAGAAGVVADIDAISEAEIVIQATPVGMADSGAEAGDPAIGPRLHEGQVVMDLVYVPQETPLISEARSRGALAVSGLGVLVHQAAIALEHWTQMPAPVGQMWVAARAAVGD